MKYILTALIAFFLFTNSLTAQYEPTFAETPDEPHYMVFLPSPGWADVREMTASIAKFNAKNYAKLALITKKYKMSKEAKMPFFVVQVFDNEEFAKKYYNKLSKPKADFLQMGITKDWFYISKSNYDEVLRARSFTTYSTYFRQMNK